VAHRRALRRNGVYRFYLLPEGLPALAGFFPGIMLTQIGYVPNVVQSSGTVEGLRQLIFIYPSLLAVITIVAMGCFYNLNEKMYVRIVEEIELRKRTA
jgi:GPH family glycoside/pentoside/hexuronide:cation symporter